MTEEQKCSIIYEGGWKELNSISHGAWACVYLLIWISLLLGAVLLILICKLF